MQHELAPRLGIDVGYFRRWFGNFQVTQLRGLTAADFDPYSVTAPLDAGLPGGGGYVINGLYNVNPTKVGVGTDVHDAGERLRQADRALERRGLSAPTRGSRTASCCRAA